MTDSMIRYVGLDVHKRVVEACLVDHAGKVVERERFALSRHALQLFATKILRPADHVALEATTNCWAVADVLRPHVARVLVSNPMATKAIAQAKVKTDKVDAHVLAQLLRCDFLPEVWQPDEATRRLRELTGRRSALVSQRTMMRNRIHSVLAMRLIEAPRDCSTPKVSTGWRGWNSIRRPARSWTPTCGSWNSCRRKSTLWTRNSPGVATPAGRSNC